MANGNLGQIMKDMMGRVAAPTDAEVNVAQYLRKHGQYEIDPQHPSLTTKAGQMYRIACSQCHALPAPRQHTASEWPAVVEERHMAWTNVVTGQPDLASRRS